MTRWKVAFALATLVAVASTALLLLVVTGQRDVAHAMDEAAAEQARRDRDALAAVRVAAPLLAAGLGKVAFADSLRHALPNAEVVADSARVYAAGTAYVFEHDRFVRAVPDMGNEVVLTFGSP